MEKEEFKENKLDLVDIKENNESIYENYDKECVDFFSGILLNQQNNINGECINSENENKNNNEIGKGKNFIPFF